MSPQPKINPASQQAIITMIYFIIITNSLFSPNRLKQNLSYKKWCSDYFG